MKLDKVRVMPIVKATLKEDIGKGDITTNLLISKLASTKASITANEDCILCGINVAEWVINAVDYSVRFKSLLSDGNKVTCGKEVAYIEGHSRAILTSERTMLNFLSFLSGIATETKKYVDKVKHYNVKILDTRKTLPLLRYLEKYAVSIGGGYNHRMNLSEMVLVKDNHIKMKNEKLKIKNLREKTSNNVKIEVEVNELKQFEKVLEERPDIIMLDNMDVKEVSKAVQIRNAKNLSKEIILEVSGGITLDNVEDYAKTGIDVISIGSLTDSVRAIDFSLNII